MPKFTSEQQAVETHKLYNIDTDEEGKYNKLHMGYRRIQYIIDNVPESSTVLEVGCNSGGLGKLLMVYKKCFVYGIDLNYELVKRAIRKGIYAREARAEKLPYSDKSMDVVVCSEVLEHLYDPLKALREMGRVSRQLIVGSVPHPKGLNAQKGIDDHAWHCRIYSHSELKKQLETVCKNVTLEDIFFYPRSIQKPAQWIGFRGEIR